MSKLRYLLIQLRSKLWIKPALTGFGVVLWVEMARWVNRWLGWDAWFDVDRDILLSLLQILASTMLTVAVFAVSAMVAAFGAVTTTATPRANRLLMQDRGTQNALAAFLSAFIYAIVGLVSVSAVKYGEFGRMTLFIGYVLIVVWVLVSFIRWVDMISRLGRVQHTIHRVEEAAAKAIEDREIANTFGAREAKGGELDGVRIFAKEIGYILHVDVAALQKIAVSLETTIRALVRPGAFVDRSRALAVVAGKVELEEKTLEKLLEAFTFGTERHAEADPRFGILMLAEIADRALSPAINDPGTAIAVIGSQVRLLSGWVDAVRNPPECEYPDVEIPPLLAGDLVEDGFTSIARDGAGMFEVCMRLQKAFRSLIELGHPGITAAARLHSQLLLDHASEKLSTAYHRDRLRLLVEEETTAEAAL